MAAFFFQLNYLIIDHLSTFLRLYGGFYSIYPSIFEDDYMFVDLLLRIPGKMFLGSKDVEILQNAVWSVNIDSLWPCRSLRC